MIATIDQLVRLTDACLQRLPLTHLQHNYVIDVLRLDKIHATISGNKWFKLRYSIEKAIKENKKGIITAGGTHSNHILATACACHDLGLHSIGIIRGQRPNIPSCTLAKTERFNMQLEFKPRATFRNAGELYNLATQNFPDYLFVEEGGKNEEGINGAEGIVALVPPGQYDYYCCAVGTGTMMAGIIRASSDKQQVIGISSLKMDPSENSFDSFFDVATNGKKNFLLLCHYHFGGYAKYTTELISFMNELYSRYSIPTDFVYTAKLLYAVCDLVKKSYFTANSRILVIHSGGLQGNCSFPAGTLLF
jgi:1-aminocyclopropane-1-carboxylate deaminase